MPTINYNAALPAFSSISGRSSIDINKWVSELKFNISTLVERVPNLDAFYLQSTFRML